MDQEAAALQPACAAGLPRTMSVTSGAVTSGRPTAARSSPATRKQRLGEPPSAEQVRLERLADVMQVSLRSGLPSVIRVIEDGGVVHEYVDATEVTSQAGGEAVDAVVVGDVELADVYVGEADCVGCRLAIPEVAAAEHDVVALLGELADDLEADPAIAPGDNRSPLRQGQPPAYPLLCSFLETERVLGAVLAFQVLLLGARAGTRRLAALCRAVDTQSRGS